MTRISLSDFLLFVVISCIANLQAIQCDAGQQPEGHLANVNTDQDLDQLGLHYSKYLQDVVAALDKDQKFTESIKDMNADDIKSGKLADQLKHVHEDIRNKLNDLKYLEIKRLRDLAVRKNELDQYGETYHGTDKRRWRTLGSTLGNLPEHMGSDATRFDVNDLHKLMVAATNDLQKIDEDRKKDYKTYEMEKEWQFNERIRMMNETERQEAIKKREQLMEQHNKHEKVNDPASKATFAEYWEKHDKLPKAEFDPKTFFTMHDTNGDGYWDHLEVKKFLEIEISKLYDPNNPEDDPNEMDEEYERMREHLYKEIDADRDGLISKREFLDYSNKPEFQKDRSWDDLSKQKAYSKQDYEDYVKNREKILHQGHGYYDPGLYANQPANFHLPNYGYGMPAGVDPSQYYGYQVDPNHPHAQQIIAQQQQHAAYQQHVAYQQHAAAAGYHQAAPYQQGAYPQVPAQPYQQNHAQIQGAPQLGVQPQGQIQQQAPIAQQLPHQQAQYQQVPQQQQQVPQQQQQVAQQQQPPMQQQQQQQQQQPNQQYQQAPPQQQPPPPSMAQQQPPQQQQSSPQQQFQQPQQQQQFQQQPSHPQQQMG